MPIGVCVNVKTGGSAKGEKGLGGSISEGWDPLSCRFPLVLRGRGKTAVVSEALQRRTEWEKHGPLEKPKGLQLYLSVIDGLGSH